MPRYRVTVKETRYEDYLVTADNASDARYKYERSQEPDATFEEMDAVEHRDGEVADWSIEEVTEY